MEQGIVKIIGKDASGGFPALSYNEMRIAAGEAKCLGVHNCGRLSLYNIHDAALVENYMKTICDKNDSVKNKQRHYMFSLKGKHSERDMQDFARQAIKALNGIGFEGQPMVVYWHNNTNNDHLHIVTCRVSAQDGHVISDWWEGAKVRRELDKLRGVKFSADYDHLKQYDFSSRNEFVALLRASGYKAHYSPDGGKIIVRRAGEKMQDIDLQEIDKLIVDKQSQRDKDTHKQRAKQLQAILLKYRNESLQHNPVIPGYVSHDEEPSKITTRSRKGLFVHHLLRNDESYWSHISPNLDGTSMPSGARSERKVDWDEVSAALYEGSDDDGRKVEDIEKMRFYHFLDELKSKIGVQIAMTTDKAGKVTGYTLIDNATKTVFKGSDVLHLRRLLNPLAKNSEKVNQDLAQSALAAVNQQQTEKVQAVDGDNYVNLDDEAIEWFCDEMSAFSPDYHTVDGKYIIDLEEQGKTVSYPLSDAYSEWMGKKLDQNTENPSRQNWYISALALHIMSERCLDADLLNFLDEMYTKGDLPFDSTNSSIGPVLAAVQPKKEPEKVKKPRNPILDTPKNKIDGSNIVEYVKATLDDREIPYNGGTHSIYVSMSEQEAVTNALKYLEYAGWDKRFGYDTLSKNAEEALCCAHTADYVHSHTAAQQTQQRPVQQQPKQEVKPVQPKSVSNKPWTIPFTDVKASVVIVNGQPFLTATINGRQHNKRILPGHYAWYQQEPYQQKAALGLAMHYFGDVIYRTQQNSYQKAFIERGKMPFSISLDYARLNTNGSMYFCNHQFRLPDGDTWSTGCEISREDFIDGINNRKSAEQIAIDNFGSKLLKEFNIGLDDLMHSIVMTASKDSVDDLKKSIGFFDEISHNHIAEFAQAFGTATLEVVLGGTHNVVGMGGTDTSLNRKPDDKDETTYQGMKPSKKKGGHSM